MSKYSDGFIVIHISRNSSDNKAEQVYKKGDLVIRDEHFHIELVMKLLKILGKANHSSSFLKIVDQATLAGSNEYS